MSSGFDGSLPLRMAGWALAVGIVLLAATPSPGARKPGVCPTVPAAPADEFAASCPVDDITLPGDEVLEARSATVGRIIFHVGDIFDPELPGEDRRLFRVINKLHRKTRESVLRRRLLFKPGDPYLRRQLDESERILRDARFLYDAELYPVAVHDGDVVDVVVQTRDVWSLQGGVGFGRSGGKNHSRFGIEDENFLGLGASLKFKRTSDVDRTTSLLGFTDENLAGKRLRIDLAYSANSDGRLERFRLDRPFFALDSRWAAGVNALSDRHFDSQYLLGDVTNRFSHDAELLEVYAGLSRGLVRGRAQRWTTGITLERDRFGLADDYPDPTFIPPDRELVYPWVGFSSIHDGYLVVRDLDKIERNEDRNVGHKLDARLGLISTAFGADRDQAIVSLQVGSGRELGPRQLVFYDGTFSGRFGSGATENVRAAGQVQYYVRDWGQHIFFAELAAEATNRLDPERQLLLGGEDGLRGYPLRFQSGDRRVVLTLEQRWYTDWHLFKLIRVGAAAFVDVGRAWFAVGPDVNPDGWLRDVGVGLRLGSSRTASASMVHVDVAVPLDGGTGIAGLQLSISSKNTF